LSSRPPRRARPAPKAKACYEFALQIANSDFIKANPTYLSFQPNYSIFLYEIIGQKQETIDLADKGFEVVVDELTERQYSEATLILQLLKDNVALWNEEQAGGKGHESPLMSCLSLLGKIPC
jgi:14-3-3 protein epsilon